MLESISIPVNTPICAFPNSNIAPNDGVKARVSCLVLVLPLVEKLSRLTLETPIPNNPLKIKVADKLGYGLIYHIRYQCISDFETLCPKLKSLDYDILFMIINLLVMLHRNNSFPKMKNHLKKTLQLIQKTLKLNNNELEIFLKIINNNIFTKDVNVQYYLNLLISEICKKL